VAVLLTLLLTTRGGTTTVLLGAAEQTATSAQATSTAEGTPPARATATAHPYSTSTPRATATPGPSVHVVSALVSRVIGLLVKCPGGELALAGGWKAAASTPIYVTSRYAHGAESGWGVDTLPSSDQVTLSILCLQGATDAAVTERMAATTIPVGVAGTVIAACAAGEAPIGGGYAQVDRGALVDMEVSPDHRGFRLIAVNHGSLPRWVGVYAECLSAPAAHLIVPPPVQQVISPQATGSVQIACPKNTLLSGGGIELLNGSAIAPEFAPISATTWQAQVKNQTIVSTTVKLSALCLSFTG
jgi:hypothetical protein